MIEEKCQKRDLDLAVLDERQGSEMSAAVDRANMDQAEEVCSFLLTVLRGCHGFFGLPYSHFK